jgi:ABC-type branched-subunit amino acid transport system permease subunit
MGAYALAFNGRVSYDVMGAAPFLIGDPSITSIAVEVLLLTGAAVAWNIFSGSTGYISLGHAAY